jgi:hypothetical protein
MPTYMLMSQCYLTGKLKDQTKGATFVIHDAAQDNNYLEPCGSDKSNGVALVCEGPSASCKR